MPTKAGRIKLEDIRQGKTIWIAAKPSGDWNAPLDSTENSYVPRAYMVVEGAKLRCAGIRWLDLSGIGQAYSFPAFTLSPIYANQFSGTLDRLMLMHFFHPDRNKDIGTLPDGSFYHTRAFTTRRRCQRACDELNRARFFSSIEDFRISRLARYQSDLVAPDTSYEKAPDVPGGIQGQS